MDGVFGTIGTFGTFSAKLIIFTGNNTAVGPDDIISDRELNGFYGFATATLVSLLREGRKWDIYIRHLAKDYQIKTPSPKDMSSV